MPPGRRRAYLPGVNRYTTVAALAATVFLLGAAGLPADVLVARAPDPAGGLATSSWSGPTEATPSDTFTYASFQLGQNSTITEVRWRGGYAHGRDHAPVTNFLVSFYSSTAGDTEPFANNPILEETFVSQYFTPDNAEETPAGVFGGIEMYDYRVALPQPVPLLADVKYWVKIAAVQPSDPDWGLAVAAGGGSHYVFRLGEWFFKPLPGDVAITLESGETPS